jgi:nucleotide-binding universal stress UspA family protein
VPFRQARCTPTRLIAMHRRILLVRFRSARAPRGDRRAQRLGRRSRLRTRPRHVPRDHCGLLESAGARSAVGRANGQAAWPHARQRADLEITMRASRPSRARRLVPGPVAPSLSSQPTTIVCRVGGTLRSPRLRNDEHGTRGEMRAYRTTEPSADRACGTGSRYCYRAPGGCSAAARPPSATSARRCVPPSRQGQRERTADGTRLWWGVDGSAGSNAGASGRAPVRARRRGAALKVGQRRGTSWRSPSRPAGWRLPFDRANTRGSAQQILDKSLEQAATSGVEVTTVVREGQAGSAEVEGADLLVVGARGFGGFRGAAARICQPAMRPPCPVPCPDRSESETREHQGAVGRAARTSVASGGGGLRPRDAASADQGWCPTFLLGSDPSSTRHGPLDPAPRSRLQGR